MIKISIEKNENLDTAFDELCKAVNYLGNKHQINYYEMFGLVECLKQEIQKSMEKMDEEGKP